MKRLIMCNTYYQLILALQMKLSLFKDDYVDVWMSDNSNNAKLVLDRLNDLNIFNYVQYNELKKFTYGQTPKQNVIDIFTFNFGKVTDIAVDLYDEIIFYNLDLVLYSISDYYDKINHAVKWSRFEEGVLSYDTDFQMGLRIKVTRNIRKYIKRSDVALKVERYYCMFPELKATHKEWEFIKIPEIGANIIRLKEILNYIFNYQPEENKQKYIFFASSSDIDGHPFGETELILKIAEKVGNDNLLVKIHPRDGRKIYEEHGIRVLKNSYIPWEVMQLNQSMDDCVLLTVNSGAFISITAMLNQRIKGVFLYPCVNCDTPAFQKRASQISDMLHKLHKWNICMGLNEYIE